MTIMDKLTQAKEYDEKEILVQQIPIEQISPDPNQVRKEFDENSLEDLSESIKKEGIIMPLIVYPMEDGYTIIAGERRFRAAKLAELTHLPCIVKSENLSSKKKTSLQLIENLQRENLTALEIAKGLQSLQKEKMNQKQIGNALGLDQSTVSRYLSVLDLKPEWLKKIEENNTNASLRDLHNIAKEKNPTKKSLLYQKLMEGLDQKVEVEIPPPIEEEKKEVDCEVTEEEAEKIWEELKKIAKKDKMELMKYVKINKVRKLLLEF